MTHRTDAEAITAEILRQAGAAGSERSISPNDVARALAERAGAPEEWRRLLGPVRGAALRLAEAGRIEILRKGKPVASPAEARGVIRLRIAGGA
ncbi:MAG: DUF3253 domain-containing protein [Acetobacteraceae bacterium]|nr:DUF3253 domain-containing protein [Acetobacteraceae bacterium]